MPLKVSDFYNAGREILSLDIESGEECLGNVIREESLNRPGLALAGFFQYFAQHRVQVLGLAEYSYLKSLSAKDREDRLQQFFKKGISCIVLTRNRHALPEILRLGEKFRIPVLRTSLVTGVFMNAATLVIEDLISPRAKVQGTMVDILGMGVIIEGEPGIGKSETALALIARGFSLVADDITHLRRDSSGDLIGRAVEITRYHMEIRGLGIIHVPSLFGIASMRDEKRLDLIVRLVHPTPGVEHDRTGLAPETRDVLGVPIPLISLPVAPGRSMAHVVEVAALNQKLKNMGHDAAKELDEKVVRVLTRQGGVV